MISRGDFPRVISLVDIFSWFLMLSLSTWSFHHGVEIHGVPAWNQIYSSKQMDKDWMLGPGNAVHGLMVHDGHWW